MIILDHKGNPFQSGKSSEWGKGGSVSKSADLSILPTFDSNNADASEAFKSNGYAKSGVQLHVDHIVGHQYKIMYQPDCVSLGVDESDLRQFVKKVESEFTLFAEDTGCYIDVERKRTFSMIMRESVVRHCNSGEITFVSSYTNKKGCKWSTSVRLIDHARISNPSDKPDSDTLRSGIHKDKNTGAMKGCYIRKKHPNDTGLGLHDSYKWVYVPRELTSGRKKFVQIFEPSGENQTRGGNAFFASLRKLSMLDKYQDSVLQNAIVNAMYAAVVESEASTEDVFKALGSGSGPSQTIANFMATKADWHEKANIKLGGVKLSHLLPNEKLKLNVANAPSSSLTEFESGILRYISRSLGCSYEQLSGDYSQVNYAAAKASLSESARYFLGKRKVLTDREASIIFELWFEEALDKGVIVIPPGMPGFYENRQAWCKCAWIGTGRTIIDELKSAKTDKLLLETGLSTYSSVLGDRGLDWNEVVNQRKREAEEFKEAGLVPIWDLKQSGDEDSMHPEVHGD